MIAHIFAMLPAEHYKTYVTSEKKTVATLSMVEMKKSLKEFWKAYVKPTDEKSGDVFYGEKTEYQKTPGKKNFNPKKNFKGDCRKCGKQGHKAADCRGETNQGAGGNTKSNANITCYKCQKKGHYARECPTKKNKEALVSFVAQSCARRLKKLKKM
jgi:hypothetical protein